MEDWLLEISMRTRNYVRVKVRTSFGNNGAKASNLPIFPSLKVKRSFLIQSYSDWSRSSSIGCISCKWSGKSRIYPNGNRAHQFAKVVYLVTEESGNAEVVRPAQPVFG